MINIQLILISIIILMALFPTIEHANLGVLNQLQTSSADMQYNYSTIRPVMQRGMYYNNPGWSRE